jgi:hypothetical protein
VIERLSLALARCAPVGPEGVSPPKVSAFDFHGVGVSVAVDDDEVRDRIEGDFSFFRSIGTATGAPVALRITAARVEADLSAIPPCRASVYTPRNICYRDGSRTWMDYFGRALAVYDRDASTFEVRSTDVDLLHEIVYLTILSRVGEKLEQRKLHRVHALALECGGEAALFLMPSGCGKSTLAMSVLRRDLPIRVLSEDSPLVDPAGMVHPFPLRLGVIGPPPEGIAPEHVVFQRRMEFEPKHLVSLAAFPGRFCPDPARARFVFLGNRHGRPGCRVQPAGFSTSLAGLARHMIVGVGLYQGVEFLLRSSLLDLLEQRRIFASRLRRALTLIRRAEVFELDLGPNPERNADEILAFLAERGLGGRYDLARDASAPRS